MPYRLPLFICCMIDTLAHSCKIKQLCCFSVWLDMRTTSTVDAILETVPSKSLNYLKPVCGLPISPYFSALKLRWLMENVPKVRQAIDDKRCCVGTVDTWLIWVIKLLILQSVNNGLIVLTKL